MNESIYKLYKSLEIGSGTKKYIIDYISSDAIVLKTTEGALRFIPTKLISALLDKLEKKEITYDNIIDRKVGNKHIVEYLDLKFDKFIFGYERNIRDLCHFCLESNNGKFKIPNPKEFKSTNPKTQKKNKKDFDIVNFKKNTEQSGLIFPIELITRFTSSLCTKPFVLLSGLSGSGKTKLAQSFAQWICKEEKQYCIVPVGADWTNREPLLGYPNALDGNDYVKPENGVLDIILHANKDKNLPYFLILDEMNLSHVERYFADFLSAMESDSAIKLHAKEKEINGVPSGIKLPSNLFIIGTVNIDETTYMFSPKVLDRANAIEFRINEAELTTFLENPQKPDLSQLKKGGIQMAESFVQIAKQTTTTHAESKEINPILIQFFSELKKAGAEFGYRSAAEIYRLINIIGEIDKEALLNTADKIDIAIMQKILPRLHGSRRKICPILITLGQLCLQEGSQALNVESSVFDKDNFNFSDDEIVRYPLSLEKISRMYNGAVDNGFTSYAEA